MKEFNEFSKEDQKLISEALGLHTDAILKSIRGMYIDNTNDFRDKVSNMSKDAAMFLIETIKSTLPEKYQ